MPIYEYRCPACERRFESLALRRGAETPRCPSCGGGAAERMLSSFAVGAGAPSVSGTSGAAAGCGTCGDPRGPGACRMA